MYYTTPNTIHYTTDFTTRGMSIQDENILEVILTRSNKELKAALEYHADETGKTLKDIIARYIWSTLYVYTSNILVYTLSV